MSLKHVTCIADIFQYYCNLWLAFRVRRVRNMQEQKKKFSETKLEKIIEGDKGEYKRSFQ